MDPRRHVPRTDVVLADPRLVAARERLGGPLVKAAVAHAQELAPDRASSCAWATAALTRGPPSRSRAATRRGSASTTSVLGT